MDGERVHRAGLAAGVSSSGKVRVSEGGRKRGRARERTPTRPHPTAGGRSTEGSSKGSREVARRNSAPGAGQRRSAPMTSDRATRETAMADQCDVIVVGGGPATRAVNPGRRFHSCHPAHQRTARQPDLGHPRRHLGQGGAWPTGRARRRRSRGGNGPGVAPRGRLRGHRRGGRGAPADQGGPFTGNMACGFLGLQYTPPDRRVIAPDAARRRLRPVVAPEPPDPPITRIDNPS